MSVEKSVSSLVRKRRIDPSFRGLGFFLRQRARNHYCFNTCCGKLSETQHSRRQLFVHRCDSKTFFDESLNPNRFRIRREKVHAAEFLLAEILNLLLLKIWPFLKRSP